MQFVRKSEKQLPIMCLEQRLAGYDLVPVDQCISRKQVTPQELFALTQMRPHHTPNI